VGSIILLLILWTLKGEWREAKEERFDLTGSVLYSIILFLIMYGFSQLSTVQGAWLVLAGFLGKNYSREKNQSQPDPESSHHHSS
jgi:uncharacterized membrane protein YdcZ (DUF606 family)